MFKNNKAIPAQHAAKPSIWVWLQQMQEKVTESSKEATAIPQCWCRGSRLWFLHINVKASHWGRALPRCNSLIKPQNRKVTAKVSLGEGREKSMSSWYNILPDMPNFQQKELGDKERNRKEVTICRRQSKHLEITRALQGWIRPRLQSLETKHKEGKEKQRSLPESSS